MSNPNFLTPPRILIPKLIRSRDAWKAKATARKAQRKSLQVRVRDLEASRDRHRHRAERLQAELDAARLRIEHLQSHPAPATPEKKRPSVPADATSPPASSNSP